MFRGQKPLVTHRRVSRSRFARQVAAGVAFACFTVIGVALAGSPETGQIAANGVTGPAARAVPNDPGSLPRVSGAQYWMMLVVGHLSDVTESGDDLVFRQRISDHGGRWSRVSKDDLRDGAQKLRGYKVAAGNMILGILQSPGVNPATRATTIEKLKKITDKNFDDPKDWVSWWTKRNRTLHLSPTNDRLVEDG